MRATLSQACPLTDCAWASSVYNINLDDDHKPDEHDYLTLYSGIVEHLKEDHGAVIGGPQ